MNAPELTAATNSIVDPRVTRITRGFDLAVNGKMTRAPDGKWTVGSQFTDGEYDMQFSPGGIICTCPDFVAGNECKHSLGLSMRLGTFDGPTQLNLSVLVVLFRAFQAFVQQHGADACTDEIKGRIDQMLTQ